MEVVEILEKLKDTVNEDYSKELSGQTIKPQTPPGYYEDKPKEESQSDPEQKEG